MVRHLLWINEEDGWIAFQYILNGQHLHYEYLEIGERKVRSWPKLESSIVKGIYQHDDDPTQNKKTPQSS
jgi:hypothetical protein